MSYDRLPPGLKEETTFCLYKLEPGKDGKKKKVPYQTCGARADPGNKAHLTDFTTAYEIYCNGGYDGIGLSVAEDMEAVDIDDCVVDGKINNKELATQLRAEIKKSRLVFSKKIVDELMELTIDFAYSTIYMMGREEYKEIFAGETYDRRQIRIYCDVIIPQRYDRIEEILGEYLDLP